MIQDGDIQGDDNGVNAQQQGDNVPIEAQVDVLESQHTTELQDITQPQSHRTL